MMTTALAIGGALPARDEGRLQRMHHQPIELVRTLERYVVRCTIARDGCGLLEMLERNSIVCCTASRVRRKAVENSPPNCCAANVAPRGSFACTQFQTAIG